MVLMPMKFEYRGAVHDALVRVKEWEAKKEYHITVMNGELEKMLYGHHVITEVNGDFLSDNIPDAATAELKQCIAAALHTYITPAPLGHAH